MIDVVGGCYYEVCLSPAVRQFYGSGGRAASALAACGDEVRLHTYAAVAAEAQVRRLSALAGISYSAHSSSQAISFAYVSPVLPPIIYPSQMTGIQADQIIDMKGDKVLYFGMLEGVAKISGKMVVYDPQNSDMPRSFASTGSTAERLAIVCNLREAIRLAQGDAAQFGQIILKQEQAEVVVVKKGPFGATVYTSECELNIPAFYSEIVFSIGSGDIFAAAFAHAWMNLNLSPIESATWASQAVAFYAETRQEKFPPDEDRSSRKPSTLKPGRIYLAGPFFNMTQRWLIEQTRSVMSDIGLEVFSPLHDVGFGEAHDVARADLAGLECCDRMFAILDGLDTGTIFEIGFARSKNIPVYIYSENYTSGLCKMIEGSGCTIISDYTTSIYHTAWRV